MAPTQVERVLPLQTDVAYHSITLDLGTLTGWHMTKAIGRMSDA